MGKITLVDHEGRLLVDYKPTTPSPELAIEPTEAQLAFEEAEKQSTKVRTTE